MLVIWGGNVILTEGLVLQERKVRMEGHDAELYFEENDIDGFWKKLKNSDFNIEYINECIENDWGERVIRIYDPDRHVIEIRESPKHAVDRKPEDSEPLMVLCYEKCSTCKKALRWLDDNGISYKVRPIKEENPTKEELEIWYRRSGLPLKRFFNTSGNIYKELHLKDKLTDMSEEEQLELLATDGMLVKRPLVVGDIILTGFKESEWEQYKEM